jgi:hypothetical protein
MKRGHYQQHVFVVGILSCTVFAVVSLSFAQQNASPDRPTQEAVESQMEEVPPSSWDTRPIEPEVMFPTPTCRAGVTQFDTGVGQMGMMKDLQSIRTALRQAVASDDPKLGQYLKERLTELIGTDPTVALEVIAGAESDQGLELAISMQAVKQSGSIRSAQVVERLLTIAEQHADLDHKALALDALKTLPSLSTTHLARLVALGKTQEPIASQAVLVIGQVMKNDDYERFEEYMARLLDVAQAQTDSSVARLALEMGVYVQPMLGNTSLSRFSEILLYHPSEDVREMAALVMSTAQDTEAVLKVYRQAFQQNSDFCSRWDIFKFSARAAGAKSLPLLEEFATLEPQFQQDYLTFKTLYDAGIVEWGRIWVAKNKQGPHSCDM